MAHTTSYEYAQNLNILCPTNIIRVTLQGFIPVRNGKGRRGPTSLLLSHLSRKTG